MKIQLYCNSYLLDIEMNEKKEIINLCLENGGGYYIMYKECTFYEGSAQGESILTNKDAVINLLKEDIKNMNLPIEDSKHISAIFNNGFV